MDALYFRNNQNDVRDDAQKKYMYLRLPFNLLDSLNMVLVVRTSIPGSFYLKPFAT